MGQLLRKPKPPKVKTKGGSTLVLTSKYNNKEEDLTCNHNYVEIYTDGFYAYYLCDLCGHEKCRCVV